MGSDRNRWWQGRRGEWLVAIQLALMVLVFFGPRAIRNGVPAPWPALKVFQIAAPVFMAAGAAFLAAGGVRLGAGLTPLPRPKDDAALVVTGPYALVRHPMYFGGFLLALGWALWVRNWLTLGYVGILFAFLDVKSRREERWLIEKFPGYASYQKRVRRIIPLLY